MKPGRPLKHMKAKWVTFTNKYEEVFFELDEKGSLIQRYNFSKRKVPSLHHIRKKQDLPENKANTRDLLLMEDFNIEVVCDNYENPNEMNHELAVQFNEMDNYFGNDTDMDHQIPYYSVPSFIDL